MPPRGYIAAVPTPPDPRTQASPQAPVQVHAQTPVHAQAQVHAQTQVHAQALALAPTQPVPRAGAAPYVPRLPGRSRWVDARGLRHHVTEWGLPAPTDDRPLLVLLHGWMDVGASFQFLVDALRTPRCIVAPDWRGFGLTQAPPTDSYHFVDYLGDLDALLRTLAGGRPIDLVGHSMGGNVAMSWAGVRPEHVRRLVNLEGFGLPRTDPAAAPRRLRQWLDELAKPARLRSYESLDDVAARLQANNPLLSPARAAWLAPHWAQRGDDGRWHVRGDPAHKRVNPVPYRVEEVLAAWKAITAPVLWVEGDRTDVQKWWGHRYPRSEFEERLAVVADARRHVLSPCGHMLHHDQPEALAALIDDFLDAG
jgi:pimeloyl-ACP methyl ester carboxylesterase